MKCAFRLRPATGTLLAFLALPFGATADNATYSSTVIGEGRGRSSASARRIGEEDLSLLPRRGAEDLLLSIPGLSLSQHGSEGKGHQYFLRGFDAGHGSDFEVSMEGIPLNEWSNIHGQGYLDLAHLIPEAIESVEITKGPFELRQGPFATAGSAVYHLGIPVEGRGLYAGYSIGSTQRHRGVITLSGEDGRDFLAVEGLQDAGFGENRQIERGALLGRIRLGRKNGEISLLAAAQLSRFGLPGALREDALGAGGRGFFDAADPEGRGRSGRALLALDATWEGARSETRALAFGGLRELEISENYTLFLRDPEKGDRRLQGQRSQQAGILLDHRHFLFEALELETGAGLALESLEQEEIHVGPGERPLSTERALSGLQSRAHLLAGLHLLPSSELRFFFGGRAEFARVEMQDDLRHHPVSGSAFALAPRARAAWKVADPWRLYAAYGRGFRPPEARFFDRKPRMSSADTAEFGLHWVPGRHLHLGGSLFASFLESESSYDHLSASFLELPSSRRLGAEIEVEARPLRWLRIGGDLSYVNARFVESEAPVPYAPWLLGGARAYWKSPQGTKAGLRFRYLAPRHLPHGARGSSLAVVDLMAAHSWRYFGLALEVENLLASRIREGDYYFPSRSDPGEPASQLPALHFVPGPPLGARLTLSAHLP